MADADLILKFQIVEGRSPNAEVAAEALAAFVDMLHAAAAAVDPDAKVRVELVDVEKGSQAFKFALRKVEDFGNDLLSGMSEFPLIKSAAITLGGLIGSTVLIVGVTNVITPDPRIPDDQMQVFEETRDLLKESTDLQREQMRFYSVLQDEPAYGGIEVLNDDYAHIYSVPRSEFAARSGVWSDEVAQFKPEYEPRTATWDAVLIKPVLVPLPRRWRFAREGLEFSALMQDPAVLQAIHDRTLPLQVAEGVMMKMQVDYREVYNGKVWIPVPGSYKVKRVLHPLPPVAPGPLFATGVPKEDD